ncbi:MAG: hypothetical protein AAFN74_13040 [Myxococcota bacterium]
MTYKAMASLVAFVLTASGCATFRDQGDGKCRTARPYCWGNRAQHCHIDDEGCEVCTCRGAPPDSKAS